MSNKSKVYFSWPFRVFWELLLKTEIDNSFLCTILGKKSLIKTEGVTKIGNNTYYYTGDKTGEESQDSQEGASTAGEDEEMEEQPGDAGLITSDPFGAYDESSNQDTDDIASNQGMCMY